MNVEESKLILRRIKNQLAEVDILADQSAISVKNSSEVRNALSNLIKIGLYTEVADSLLKSRLLRNRKVSTTTPIDSNNESSSKLRDDVLSLKVNVDILLEALDSIFVPNVPSEDIIRIKLPQVTNFADLEKASSDFKKAIEIPVLHPKLEGKLEILSAEPGSIWLIVSLGSIAALKLVAGTIWAAAVIKKKKHEAKIFEEHAKTLNLKNEMLATLVQAQKEAINTETKKEASALSSEFSLEEDPEYLEKLKLSMNILGEFLERGAKFYPGLSSSEEVSNLFPKYDELDKIESRIKLLKENGK